MYFLFTVYPFNLRNIKMTNSRPSKPDTDRTENTEIKNSPTTPTLNPEIEKAAQSATSNLAMYVFDNKNRSYFDKLLATKSPAKLVLELNKINPNPDKFKQFQIFTSHQNEYAELFDLPPAQWMTILLEEKINGDDLAALIGSSDMFEGAVSGRLNEIEEKIADPIKKAKIFFYLNHSPNATPEEINAFFKKIGFEDDGILFLHHILHNVFESSNNEDLISTTTRFATEGILRIRPVGSDVTPEKKAEIELDNKARVKAALRILQACVDNHYNKALKQLSDAERIIMQLENDEFLANQLNTTTPRHLPAQSSQGTSNMTIADLENRSDLQNVINSLIANGFVTTARPNAHLHHDSSFNVSLINSSSIIIIRGLSASISEQKDNNRHEPNQMEYQSDDDMALQNAIAESLKSGDSHSRRSESQYLAHSSVRINEQKGNHHNEMKFQCDDGMEMELQYAIAQSLKSDNPHSRQSETKETSEEKPFKLVRRN